jgi:hypothetical protein
MGSFDYNDNYSSFDSLLERCEVFTEGGKGLGGYYSGFGKNLTGRLRDVGSTAVPRDSRKFVVHVLYTQLDPKIITDEDLTELESAGPEAGSRYNLTLQKILDIHKDEITKRADEIGQVIEDRFPALANEILGRGPQRIQGNIDARKARLHAKEIANDIKQGEDIDDSIDDALDGVLVQAAISKVLTNIQSSLGEPGLDIEEEALQEVVDYAERIQTVDQLSDFVRQIAREPGYQKIALYLSAVVKPLRGNKPEEDYEEDEAAPFEGMYEPGDSENAYAEGESEAQSTQIEDEEEVISRESLNNNMQKKKLLFEKDLDAAERRALPDSDFALPGKGEGPEGKQAGSYPIPDEEHARMALAMVAKHGTSEEKKRVRAAVARKFPGINQEDEEFKYSPMLDSYQSNTSDYLTEQVAKDKRNNIKPRSENQSFKKRFNPKTHWQLQELRRRGL